MDLSLKVVSSKIRYTAMVDLLNMTGSVMRVRGKRTPWRDMEFLQRPKVISTVETGEMENKKVKV